MDRLTRETYQTTRRSDANAVMPIVEVLARYRDRRDLHTQPAVIVHIDIIDINRAQSTRIQPSQPQTEPPSITRPSRQTTSTWCGPTAVSCQTTTCCRPRARRAASLRRPHSPPSGPSMSPCESRPCACACCNLSSRIFDADQHTAQTHASAQLYQSLLSTDTDSSTHRRGIRKRYTCHFL